MRKNRICKFYLSAAKKKLYFDSGKSFFQYFGLLFLRCGLLVCSLDPREGSSNTVKSQRDFSKLCDYCTIKRLEMIRNRKKTYFFEFYSSAAMKSRVSIMGNDLHCIFLSFVLSHSLSHTLTFPEIWEETLLMRE